MKDPNEHGLQLINRYSGLPGTVVSWDVTTDTVIVRLACGQEADYSIQDISTSVRLGTELWLIKKPTHGGARKGAGRPVTKEPTVVMRIPISKVEAVKKLIKGKIRRGKVTKSA